MKAGKTIVSFLITIALLTAIWAIYPRNVSAQVHEAIVTVDITGTPINATGPGNNATYVIAVGYGTNLTCFTVSKNQGVVYFDEAFTEDVGFDVDYVAISEGLTHGPYVVVAGNERPFTNTSHGYVKLYAPFASWPGPEPLLYDIEVDHSIYSSESRPIDIMRNATHVAFGTGIVDDTPPANHIGMVYLVETPPTYTPRPTTYTYNYEDWIQSVRFAGDNDTLIVGTFWNHSFAKFTISNVPPFTPDWKEGNVEDPYYAVAPSFDAFRIATGHGHAHRILYERGSNGGFEWHSLQSGTQRRIVLDDDHDYFVSTQYPCCVDDAYAFHYFNTTSPPPQQSKPPMWTFNPTASPTRPVAVDSSVSNTNLFVIGGTGARVYRWGNGSEITWSAPNFTFVANGTVNDVAMNYDGEYSVAGDAQGYLYVFDKDEAIPMANWRS